MEKTDGRELNLEDCTIGLSADEQVAIITVPLAKYALDDTNGNALIYGKMREIQAHLMQMAAGMRRKKDQLGLVKVNGKAPIDLKVY